MAGVQPTKFINYISQFKKLLVTRNNGIISQKFKIDSATDDNYYFSIVNSNNRLIDLTDRTFKIYGSIFDSKDQMHILFYSDKCTIEQNGQQMHFKIDTYTSQYMNIVKTNKIIDLTIVEIVNPDDNIPDEEQITQVILRDQAIAYKRPYIENQTPAEILQKVILTSNVPLTGVFGAGQDINLTIGSNGAAFGTGLTQTGDNQLVIGKYNEADNTKVFVIGNGSNDTARSNLFTIDYDGNITTSGALSATAVYVNGQEVGTQVDQKLASTSAWVNETFETKDASTSAYNSLVEEISAVDLKVDGLSSTVVSDYALKSELATTSTNIVDAIPTKVSDLTNDAGYITSSEIPTDYVTNGQLDKAISSFITIEDVPVYTADNKTLQLNGTEFSIKSLESKISGGVGINVTTTDDVTWITYIGGSSTGGKTYLNGTGLGLSTVSAEDGIYKLYVNQSWLEGKIEAQTSGSFDDISISIDNVSGIVDSNYETLTGQTNYLSGQIDASNQTIGAVSDRVQIIENDYTTSGTVTGWINDLATGAVKTNSDSIDYLSGQISANTASIGELNTSKADLSGFQELTGVVDGINTNLTSNYYTKTEIDTATGAIDERLTGLEENTAGYQNAEQVSGIVEGYNYITSADIPQNVSYFTNDALYVTSGELTGALNDYTKTTDLNDYLSSGILTDYVTDQQLEEKEYATTGIVDAASSAILSTLTGDYALKTDIPTEDEITGLAKDYVDTLNIDTTYATKSEINDFATSSEVETIIGDTVTSGYVHDLGFITNSEVEPGTIYSTGFGLAASGDAFNIFYLTGTVLSGSEHISIENNVVSLIGEVGKTYNGTANGGVEVDNTNNTITISSNFLSSDALDSYGDKTWVETNFLSTSYSTTIEGNSQAIEDIQGVTGTFALKADIPADIDDFATSAEVSGIVEGLSTAIRTGLALTSDIPTTVAELTDSGDYALKSELIDTEDVSGVVEDMSGAIINGLALTSDIPTGLDDWDENTNKDYISGLGFITLQQVPPGSVYSTSFGLAASGDSNNIFYLTAGVADLNGYDTLALKSDLPNSGYITGLAKDYVDSLDLAETYASATDFNSVCTALSDAITGLNNTLGTKANSADVYSKNEVYTKTEADEAFLSSNTFIPVSASQLSGYDELAQKSDLTNFIDAASANTIANEAIASTVTSSYITGLGIAATDTTYSDGNLIAITGATNTINFTGTIPTKTSDLENDSEFATSGYVTGYCSSFITIEDVPTKVSQLQNDVAYLPSTGLSSVYSLLSGENINITQAVDGTITLSAGTGGGGKTYTAGYGLALSGQDNTEFYLTADIPTYTAGNGIYINNSDVISLNIAEGPGIHLWWSGTAHVEAKLSSAGSVSLSTLEDNTILISGTEYQAGTGLELDGTEFSLSAAGANEDKVLSSHNGTISWQTNVAGTDIDTVCGMLSSANENLTISKTDNKILFTATGGGGGSSYSAGDYISLANDTIAVTGLPAQVEYICGWVSGMPSGGYTAGEGIAIENGVISASGGSSSGPTNKQLVSSGFTYDPTIEIYKNEYTPTDSVITLGEFTVPAGSLAENEVATFEEWVTASSTVTGFAFNDVILIGELPSAFTDKYYYVFSRRINSNGDQFISFAYECTTDKYGIMPLTIKSVGGTTTVSLSATEFSPSVSYTYSKNGSDDWSGSISKGNGSITLQQGEYVSFSGTNATIGNNYDNVNGVPFVMTGTGKQIVYGNLASLTNWNGDQALTGNGNFIALFYNCTNLVDASKLKMPYQTLTNNSYRYMFYGCTSLTAAPELPAKTLASNSYSRMFYGCTSLSSVPVVKATSINGSNQYSFEQMFASCTTLTGVEYMLTATNNDSFYYAMNGCTNLQYVKVHFTNWGNQYGNGTWLQNVAANGEFHCPTALGTNASITRGTSYVPVGWTVINDVQ